MSKSDQMGCYNEPLNNSLVLFGSDQNSGTVVDSGTVKGYPALLSTQAFEEAVIRVLSVLARRKAYMHNQSTANGH